MLAVISIAEARPGVETFFYLRVARGARIARVLVKIQAARVPRLAHEVEQPPQVRLGLVHEVLVAQREIAEIELISIMLDELEYERVVPRAGGELVGAVPAVSEVVEVGGKH